MNSLEFKDSIFPDIITGGTEDFFVMITGIRVKKDGKYYLSSLRQDKTITEDYSKLDALKDFIKLCYRKLQGEVFTSPVPQTMESIMALPYLIMEDVIDENQEEMTI